MFIITQDEKLNYTFQNGATINATFEQLESIAKILGESLDYNVLCKTNGIKNNYYESQKMGPIAIEEMDTEHIKNALLKKLRVYFERANFKDLDDDVFMKRVNDPDIYDDDIDMLYSELQERIG